MSIEIERARASVVTLGNAADLATRIVKDLAGGDIAQSINKSALTSEAVRCLVVSRMQRNISKLKPTE
jgi:FixJ family two-component response regulator